MPVRLFVSGLAPTVTEDDLRQHFGTCGQVLSAVLFLDADRSDQSFCGFVHMADDAGTRHALTNLNGRKLRGHCLAVIEARPRKVWLGRRLDESS
jgi:RNA recognition motif-containing protein